MQARIEFSTHVLAPLGQADTLGVCVAPLIFEPGLAERIAAGLQADIERVVIVFAARQGKRGARIYLHGVNVAEHIVLEATLRQ